MGYDISDFEKEVIERSRTIPVLVDFWAEWCGPCRVLGPVLERLAAEAGGRWVLAKVDTEAMPDVAQRYEIVSIPNVKLFVNGEMTDEFVGARPEPEVRRWLEAAIPSPQTALLDEAKVLVEAGDYEPAATKLKQILDAEPGNRAARMFLGVVMLHTDPAAVEETLKGVGNDPKLADRAEALRHLAGVVLSAGNPDSLPESPARETFLIGAKAIRDGAWDPALAAFISVLHEDRKYADGAARDAGRAIFQLLGIRHPICEKYHRAFSSAVNV